MNYSFWRNMLPILYSFRIFFRIILLSYRACTECSLQLQLRNKGAPSCNIMDFNTVSDDLLLITPPPPAPTLSLFHFFCSLPSQLAFSSQKRTSSTSNMKFLNFFLLLRGIFALLDPDPDPLTQLNPACQTDWFLWMLFIIIICS
jgi:hypothetical protein